MKTGAPDTERLPQVSRRANSSRVGSPTKIKVIRVPFELKDTVGALADHVVYKEHSAEEEHLLRAEKTVAVS